jgi:glutamate-1-semialdehyde 2,1-aminomutase
MELVSPVGAKKPWERLFHSGTYNGCPVVLAAGLATIDVLEQEGAYEHINWVAEQLKNRIRTSFESYGVDVQILGVSSMFQPIFTPQKIRNYRDVAKSDLKKRINFDIELINRGVYVRPGKTYYASLAHSKGDVEKTLSAIDDAVKTMCG